MKRLMTDILIGGTAVTGAVTLWQFGMALNAFIFLLAVVNLSTSLFLATFVRPLIMGRAITATKWAHGSLLVLLGSSGALFWVEYFGMAPRLGALTAAITWSIGTVVYAIDLALPARVAQPAPATANGDPVGAPPETAPVPEEATAGAR